MKINTIIKYLTISDFIVLSGFGLIAPIFAIFIVQNIKDATIETAGFATFINIFTKAILQLPIARYLDKKRGDIDEFYFVIAGSFILSLAPLLYLIIRTPAELYLSQFIYGVGLAINYPSWMSLFTRHAEKEREGSQWAVYSTATGVGAALAAAIGGVIADRFGFNAVFWLVFLMGILGSMSLVKIYQPLKLRHEHHKIKQSDGLQIKT